jgi:hypothetical protein
MIQLTASSRRAAELHGFSLTLQRSEYGGLEVKLEGSLHAA